MNETLKMPSIMQSIKPQYCKLIASGKKTIEVRKTKPKIPTPFKVYIYCTKARIPIRHNGRILMYEDDLAITNRWGQGKRVENPCGSMMDGELFLNGKVIGEYICNEISDYCYDTTYGLYRPINEKGFFITDNDVPLDDMCLNQTQLIDYGKDETLRGWHISELKIYDKPKELSNFFVVCKKECCDPHCISTDWDRDKNGNIFYECKYGGYTPLFRPPQSWCYVEEI